MNTQCGHRLDGTVGELLLLVGRYAVAVEKSSRIRLEFQACGGISIEILDQAIDTVVLLTHSQFPTHGRRPASWRAAYRAVYAVCIMRGNSSKFSTTHLMARCCQNIALC